MTWNYRLAKKTVGKGTSFECTLYGVVEAYYNEDGSIWATSENFQQIGGLDNVEDILWTLETMLNDVKLGREVIDLDTITYAALDKAIEGDYSFSDFEE